MAGKRDNWTPEENAIIRKNYPWHSSAWPGWGELLPGRTIRAIQMHANRLGVKKINQQWSPEADEQLAQAVETLCKRLHRGPESIAKHIKTLRLYGRFDKWTELD